MTSVIIIDDDKDSVEIMEDYLDLHDIKYLRQERMEEIRGGRERWVEE